MADVAIRARGLSKRYRVFDSQVARLLYALAPSRRNGVADIWALRDVDLEIARGESVAVIGRNGGGKSTLLQVLTGTLPPTSGEVEVKGRVGALLELGSGFNPEYTGRDNVVMNGLILGATRAQIERRFAEIAAFADIGEAIDRPVRTYSSGMLMRLAFAVQVLTDPEVLVIDEALSVGDFFFQQKCLGFIRSLCERGVTLVFVSHDMSTVRDLCRRTIYLREGRVAFDGETGAAIYRYLAERRGATVEPERLEAEARAGAGELETLVRDSVWRREGAAPAGAGQLIAIAIYGDGGRAASSFRMGETMRVAVAYRPAPGAPTHVAVALRNKYDQVVTTTGSAQLAMAPPEAQADDVAIFDMELDLRLEAGTYSIMVTLGHLAGPNRGRYLDSSQAVGPISIHWDYEQDLAPFLGMFGPRAAASFRRVAGGKAG